MSALTYEHVDGIARITLNNPPQNRIGGELSAGLGAAVMDLAKRSDTRVVLLRAEGPDFSFGGDITKWPEDTAKEFGEGIAQGVQLTNVFQDLPVPIVVAAQGHCRGGGFELTLRGDYIIAADNPQFGHSEATIGVFTFLGGVQRVAERVGRTRAMQWAMTAELVDAQTALQTGLVNEVVPVNELDDRAEVWAKRLAKTSTLAHAAHKQLLRAWSSGGIAEADALMGDMAEKIMGSDDAQKSLVGAIEAVKAGTDRPVYPFAGK